MRISCCTAAETPPSRCLPQSHAALWPRGTSSACCADHPQVLGHGTESVRQQLPLLPQFIRFANPRARKRFSWMNDVLAQRSPGALHGTEIPALYVKGSGWDLAVRSQLNDGPYLLSSMLSQPRRTLLPGPHREQAPRPPEEPWASSSVCGGRDYRSLARSAWEVLTRALVADQDSRASPTNQLRAKPSFRVP
jgi:hypothetical protein